MGRLIFLLLLLSSCTHEVSTDKLTQENFDNLHQIYIGKNNVACLFLLKNYKDKATLKIYDRKLNIVDSSSIFYEPHWHTKIRRIDSNSITLCYNYSGKIFNSRFPNKRQLEMGANKVGHFKIDYTFAFGNLGEQLGKTYKYTEGKILGTNKTIAFRLANLQRLEVSISDLFFVDGDMYYMTKKNGVYSTHFLEPNSDSLKTEIINEILNLALRCQ